MWVLPFNSKLNEINKDYYKYLALIIYENKQFFLKIINLDNNIEETEKINLAEYSSEFEALIDDNNILDIYGKNEKENENIKEEKVEKFDLFFHIQRFQNVETKKVFFDMSYDIKTDENIILIINFIRSWGNKKLTIIFDIDLRQIQFS